MRRGAWTDLKEKRTFIVNTVYILLIATVIWLGFRYALPVVRPFVVGFCIAAVIEPPVRYLTRKCGMRRRPLGILLLLLLYATFGMILTVAAVRLTVWVSTLPDSLPILYQESIEPAVNEILALFGKVADYFDRLTGHPILGIDIDELINAAKLSLGTAFSDFSVSVLTDITHTAAKIPGIFAETVFSIIVSFFVTVDLDRILTFLKKVLPEKTAVFLRHIRDRFYKTSVGYLRSYALIFFITFAELFIGLTVLGIKNAVMIALGVAFFDILPILGTGGILLPWAVVMFFSDKVNKGIGLVAVWAIISAVRYFIEPKIVGKQVGLPPLAALAAIYIGAKLFGFLGLILCPILLSVFLSKSF